MVTATTPSSGYVAASSLRKGTMRFWAAKNPRRRAAASRSAPGSRPSSRDRRRARRSGVRSRSPKSISFSASATCTDSSSLRAIGSAVSIARSSGLENTAAMLFAARRCAIAVRLPLAIRSKRHARHAAAQGVADPVVRGVADEIKGRRHLSGPRAARPSPAMKRAVRSRASLSVNCCGGDFMK